ncbi:MAG TPA: succinate dehydrogenase [Candidatus Polarisedimenticolia bacterium]|nr:succinate dehydrogenase [Candidatus Polarisedimenticolia bacterium]
MAERARAFAPERFGSTCRKDAWWLAPALTVLGLGVLGAYATWGAFQGTNFKFGGYLSPLYSPEIHPSWWPLSPALLILLPPMLFRTTCYYYRKAYYRSFFLDPAGCAVGEMHRGKYTGETKFPFVLQNLHRYAFYLAFIWLFFLWHDVWKALWFDGKFGIGLGTIVILASTGMLTLYTFSCHSWRHLVGGKLDCFSCTASARSRHGIWSRVTALNEHHMGFAWISLFAVVFADVYVRMLAMGIWHDVRFL